MKNIESRDFYTVIASGMGGLTGLILGILLFGDTPEIVGMLALLGSEAAIVLLFKALRIFEQFQGVEWRLKQK